MDEGRKMAGENLKAVSGRGEVCEEAAAPRARRNYQREMEQEISLLNGRRPTLLLHSCCGPCSSAVLERLAAHFRITLLYYNPNIEPEAEYSHRLAEQKRLLSQINLRS